MMGWVGDNGDDEDWTKTKKKRRSTTQVKEFAAHASNFKPPNLIGDPWGGNWSLTAALFIGGFVREGEHFSSVKYNVSRKYGLSK